MNFVKYPDFVLKDGQQLKTILCKVCGTEIAGMTESVKGDPQVGRFGEKIITRVQRFSWFHNFVELKMSLDDGSAHITTGCDRCLVQTLNTLELDELMQADIEEQRPDLGNIAADRLKARRAIAILGIKLGGGIV